MTPKEQNDFFYVCSLIEYIGRKTKNKRSVIVEHMGETGIRKQTFIIKTQAIWNVLTKRDIYWIKRVSEVRCGKRRLEKNFLKIVKKDCVSQ